MPPNNPTAGDLHVNRPLTNWAMKWQQDQENFIAMRAMPSLGSKHRSDDYYIYDRADWLRDAAQEREDGTESAGGGYKLTTDTFRCKKPSFHKDVTDDERANADDIVDPEEDAAEFVSQKLLIRRERDFAGAYMGTGIWSADVSPTAKWNTATGEPIKDIRLARRTVQGNTGYWPNRGIFGRDAWDALLDSDEVLDRIKGGALSNQPAKVQRQLLASLFELEEIFVMDAVFNAANEGAAEATQRMVNDVALLYFAPATVGRKTPCAGKVFNWTGRMGATPNGMRIKRIRMEHLNSWRVEGEMSFVHKVTAPELGYFFNDTNA